MGAGRAGRRLDAGGARRAERVAYKRGATRLGFALLLKFFEIEGRFPAHVGELPPAAIDYVARQVGVEAGELAGYEWSGRSVERHRGQIRRVFGFRRFAEEDEARLADWLAGEVAATEFNDERLAEALLTRCRVLQVEPPTRVGRIIGAARATVADRFTAATVARLSPASIEALEALVGIGPAGTDPAAGAWLAELKADPGKVGRDTATGELASWPGYGHSACRAGCSMAGRSSWSPRGGPKQLLSIRQICAGTPDRCA